MCKTALLRCPCDVVCRSPAGLTAKGDVGIRRRGYLLRVALDGARARRTAERSSTSVLADQKKSLSRVVRIRTRLAHEISSYFDAALHG